MANISRPFQIALIGVVVLAGVWLFALHGSGSSSSSSSSSTPASTPAPTASSSSQKAGAPSPVYHGSAPGVAGLTSAVAKAHGAVATSQANEKQLEARSAAASGNSPTANSTPAPSKPAKPATRSTGGTAAAPAVKSRTAPKTPSVTHGASSRASASRQRQVEAKIAAGNVVLVLFWNKKGADDRADLAAVRSFARGHAKVAVEVASGHEVAAFGTITRGVQIYGTPTVLAVGRSGKAIVVTGLTDPFSLSQAITQARHAS